MAQKLQPNLKTGQIILQGPGRFGTEVIERNNQTMTQGAKIRP